MGALSITQKGDFSKTVNFLTKAQKTKYWDILHRYGKEGVLQLSMATPVDTHNTASSWYYEIIEDRNSFTLQWSNSNIKDGVPIVILLQYGHGTKDGGYIVGRNFINPVMKPIFDRLGEEMWREVHRI